MEIEIKQLKFCKSIECQYLNDGECSQETCQVENKQEAIEEYIALKGGEL